MSGSKTLVERAWEVWCGREPSRLVAGTVGEYRAGYDRLFGRFPVAGDVHVAEAVVGGVPGLRLRVGAVSAERHILYFHGGGYMSGNPEGVRDLAGRLARAAGAEAFLADYRLAPEHP
ncbi:MAG: alpha/beta hydrolase fold domain-containing protein, partial [Acidimicrobiia bacterium]